MRVIDAVPARRSAQSRAPTGQRNKLRFTGYLSAVLRPIFGAAIFLQ